MYFFDTIISRLGLFLLAGPYLSGWVDVPTLGSALGRTNIPMWLQANDQEQHTEFTKDHKNEQVVFCSLAKDGA